MMDSYQELKDEGIKQRKLDELIASDNIASDLDDDELKDVSCKVLEDLELDEKHEDRVSKLEKWKLGEKIARQVIEAKNTPFENAANVKYPIMVVAAIQFYSRAYPAIITGNGVVKPKVVGKLTDEKEAMAKRACDFMNYQILDEMQEWEDDTQTLLLQLSLYGTMYRKMMFSGNKNRAVSKLLTPKKLIIPASCSNIETASRVSELFDLTCNEIVTRIRSGIYKHFEFCETDDTHEFVEQHRYLDLDKDGYKEPYIVTLHKETGSVVRIQANYRLEDVKTSNNKIAYIAKKEFYVDYKFFPSLDSTPYGTGFFDILYPLNETINTNLNQLLDAGTLSNTNSGFIGKELRIGKGEVKFKLGEYKSVNARGQDLRTGIVPMQFTGPSSVLFHLLGFLVDAARDVANVKDVLTGEGLGANASPTTTLALIEEGSKVFSAIYKGIHRSLGKEFRLLKKINAEYLNPNAYVQVLDEATGPEDFSDSGVDFIPVSDPGVATNMQQIGRAQFIGQFMGHPLIDPKEVLTRQLNAANIPDIDKLWAKEQQGPSFEQRMEAQRLDNEKLRLQLDIMRLEAEKEKIDAKILVDKTAAIKNLAEAESKEVGNQLAMYHAHMTEIDNENQQGGVPGMEGQPSNQAVPAIPEGMPESNAPSMGRRDVYL